MKLSIGRFVLGLGTNIRAKVSNNMQIIVFMCLKATTTTQPDNVCVYLGVVACPAAAVSPRFWSQNRRTQIFRPTHS